MRKSKYTLVEILTVIIIIAILAGIIFGASGVVKERSGEVKTRSMMKQIQFGLEECKRKFGYYPVQSSFGELERETLFMEDGADSAENTHKKKYSVAFKKACDYKSLKVENNKLVDYYGHPFMYKSDGKTFTIFSKGLDGMDSVLDADNTDDLNNNNIKDVKEKLKDSDIYVVDLDNIYLD